MIEILMPQKKKQVIFFKKSRWCVANQLSIKCEKTHFVLFHAKNKPIPEQLIVYRQPFLPFTELNLSNI